MKQPPKSVFLAEDPVSESPDNIPDDPLMIALKQVIRLSVRGLALLMTAVIVWGVLDVVLVLYEKLMEPPFLLLKIDDILATFGAFMAVLIAIEIFVNITVYLREDVIHVRIVMATALMAIARKVIILNTEEVPPEMVLAIAAAVLAMSTGYYLVVVRDRHIRKGDQRTEQRAPDES